MRIEPKRQKPVRQKGRKPMSQMSVEPDVASMVRQVAEHDEATLSDTIRRAFACWIKTERNEDFVLKAEA